MTAQTMAGPGADLLAPAWLGLPPRRGCGTHARSLCLASRHHTCVSCFSLVTGCGITFSSPWTNQANILVTRNHR